MRARLPLAAVLVMTACASQGRNTTWDQDRKDGVDGFSSAGDAPRASARIPNRRSMSLDSNLDLAVDYTARAFELELALVAFVARRRSVARGLEPPVTPGWPAPILETFDGILATIDRALVAPAGVVPGRILIQTRVALEVELDQTRHTFGEPPEKIGQHIRDTYVRIAVHMRHRASRNLGRSTKPRHQLALGWPLSPLIVTSPFGYRRDPILGEADVRFHAGVDLGGSNGDVVASAGPGRVVSVGWKGGHGRTVIVQHAGGYITMYAHLKRTLVVPGVELHRGSPIGLVGTSGRSTGPHLHFEVRRGSIPIDPMDAIGLGLGPVASSSP